MESALITDKILLCREYFIVRKTINQSQLIVKYIQYFYET
ncbi:hypothetical protein B194_4846 [Serratia plymuthica A30]|nr:hypothetical protein B194_4846 [Serratia plymuthica A30]